MRHSREPGPQLGQCERRQPMWTKGFRHARDRISERSFCSGLDMGGISLEGRTWLHNVSRRQVGSARARHGFWKEICK